MLSIEDRDEFKMKEDIPQLSEQFTRCVHSDAFKLPNF